LRDVRRCFPRVRLRNRRFQGRTDCKSRGVSFPNSGGRVSPDSL